MTSILPSAARDHALAARWATAWTLASDAVPELMRAGSLDELLWLHELALRLGLDARRRWIGRLLRQRHPDSARVLAVTMLDRMRRGHLVDAFQLAQQPWPPQAAAADRVPWLLAKARVAHELRDHEAAQALLDEAESLRPDDPTVLVERLWSLQSKDQMADAIAMCEAGRRRFPAFGNLVVVECWLRHDANTPELAAFLATARQQVESPFLDSIQANLAYENGDLATARQLWEALLLQPWHERRMRVGWHFALLHLCREQDDHAAALAHALAAGRAGATAAERLRTFLAQQPPPPRTRVVLPVPFVRQDHQTCSPATMASLLSFFDVAADQREIAGQITWDGTASHDELRWARARGLSIRFFAWDAAVARDLLARGLPFAISTRFETNGHRQAVVGHDSVLDTFVLRDPTGHYRREVDAAWLETLLQRGGDCALLLPTATAAATAVPPLPAETETMEWLQLRLDLEARRLAGTAERTASLLARTTGPLHFDIETRTLHERGERSRRLEAYVQAHERAPDDPYWQYRLAAERLDQDRWQDARTFLERVAPGSSSPFLWRLLAEQWSHDARRRPQALALMHRALRRLARDPRSWLRQASILWDDDRKDEATAFYRIAAMLAPQDEWMAGSYFRALRGLGRSEAGLVFLQQRATQALGKSAAPAGTLADALESLHRPDEAISVLRTALASDDTPDQRDRLCQLLLRLHRHDEAAALLADRDRFEPVDHALRSHQLAVARNDRAGIRTALQAAVAAMPTHTGAQRGLLDDLLAVEGLDAALARADQLVAEHGDHPALLADVADFFRRVDDHARVGALMQRLVQEHPDQHWLRGRLARHLIARGRFDDAAPLLAELQQATPRSSAVQVDIADHARATGQPDVARQAARTALQLAPDNIGALHLLLNLARDRDEAIAALRLAMQLLLERPQPPQKDDLAGLVGLVTPLPDGEFDAFLQRLAANFPAESAIPVTRCEYLLRDDPAAALPIAESLVQKEAWRTDHHLLLARCLRACNRRADERAALEALLQIDPACTQAFVEIGESFDQEGRLPQAMATFDRGLAVAPGFAVLHGMLADAAWRLGERDRALLAAQRAADLDPGYAWAFSARIDWLCELGRIGEATALASDLVRDNPLWATAHDLNARALANAGRHQESIAALQQALVLSPRLGSTRLVLLDALVAMKRFDEARTCLADGVQLLGDHPPLRLRECALTRAQGQLPESRQQLRELLQRHPDYDHGWRRLLGWLDEEGLFDEILALYREPPEALRTDNTLRGYAGDVLQKRNDSAGAIAAFEQALAIDQGYQWAREQLCQLLLAAKQFDRVLELLPDHADPDRLPWNHAVLVGKAFAHSGRTAEARTVLVRLMRDESWRGMDAADLDGLLRASDRAGHERFLQKTLAANNQDTTFVLHWLRILGRRQQWRRFWDGIDDVHTALGPTGDLLPVVGAIVDVSRDRQVPDLARWARRHLRPPIQDIRVAGQLMYLLSDDAREQRQLVRLMADGWRRPGVEGWMLANMSSAFVDLGRLDEAEQVLQFAFESVPQDHSVWWFHRDRAEIALRRRDWAACRAAHRDPPAEYPTVRLSAWQIDLCAELRQLPWWRRGSVLRRRLRRSFELRDLAMREPRAQVKLRVRDLWDACPGLTTGLLCCGRAGRWLVRRWLRV